MGGVQIHDDKGYGGPFEDKHDRYVHFHEKVLHHICDDMCCGERHADWWIERGDMEDVDYFIDMLRRRFGTWEIGYDEDSGRIEMRKE